MYTKKLRNSGKMCKQLWSAGDIYLTDKTRKIKCAKTTMIRKKKRCNNYLKVKYKGLLIDKQIIIKNFIRFFHLSSFT